jgi:mannose-6-phosphate isomerase-like protein (cupin superfamily)
MPTAAVKSDLIDSIPTLAAGPDDPEWKPLRLHLGITAFGVNAWIAREAGQDVIGRHTETEDSETRHEELYVVTRGSATFTVDGHTIEAPEGSAVFVPDPDSVRHAVANEPGTTVLVVGATPGEGFRPSAWETKYA